MSMRYPFLDLKEVNSPYMDEMIEAASRVIRSGRYIGGPEVDNFEKVLGELTGTSYTIGVSNGLDALRLILKSYVELGAMSPDDEVIEIGRAHV